MASLSLATVPELVQELYPDGLDEILYKKSPTWGMLTKKTDFTDLAKNLDWKFSTGGGGSTKFGNAQANKGAPGLKKPLITRTREYALASMDGELLDASGPNSEAVASAFKVAMDDALYLIRRSLGFHIFRNGGGARAQLASAASGVATTVLQLSSSSSMQGIEKGLYLQASATDGTSGAVLAGKNLVTDVNRDALTVTGQSVWNVAIPGITDSYYLFRDGDFGDVIKGFQAWVPDAAPSPGENFFGIDRSSDTRLYGNRYAPTGGLIEEILIDAAALASDAGGDPDLIIMHPKDMANLQKQMGSKQVIPVNAQSADKPNIGYRGFMLISGSKAMTVLSDPCCPRYKVWMLTQDSWEIWSLKEIPRVLQRDGNETMRESNADADELRVGGYLQMVCRDPRGNVNITLPSA